MIRMMPRIGQLARVALQISVALCASALLAPRAAAQVPELEARLALLTPDDAEAYFLLAEEVHDEADSVDEADLARRLYVLAFVHHVPGVGVDRRASICIALSDLARNEQDRRWLSSLGFAIDPDRSVPDWASRRADQIAPDTAYLAATAIGLSRAGEGRMAERMLAEPGVLEAIERYDDLLAAEGLGDASEWLTRTAERWPCPNCRNERVVAVTRENPPRRELCAVCEGDPGPKLSESERIATLRFESRLLTGIHKSWAAQIAADLGAPLRDADPAQLPLAMGVDPELVLYRDGAWVAAPPSIGEASEGGGEASPPPGANDGPSELD